MEVKPAPVPEKAGVKLSSLSPGESFTFKGEEFVLERLESDVAKVILQERALIKVALDKTKEIVYGIARLEMPARTLVCKTE